jgi:hypothetical protein
MTDTNGKNLPVPAADEAKNIGNAAQEDGGFETLLKFKKGEYFAGGEEVPLGTEYIAHCIGWTRGWTKFENQQVTDRKMYRVADGRRPADRDELDSRDEKLWPIGISGAPADPWVFQFYLPMESRETGEVVIFVTSSFGGKRAVADLCKAYSRRVARTGKSEQPVIRLGKAKMPTRQWGDVPRPDFEVIGWTGDEHEGIREVKPMDSVKDELDDEIPF